MSEAGLVAPWLALFAGAALLPFVPSRWRWLIVMGAPATAFWLVWQVPDGVVMGGHLLDYELAVVEGDRLRRLFGSIFTLMGVAGGLFALGQARTVELAAALAYAGASLGVVFAGDLITLLVFWEVMALASTAVLWASGTQSGWRASRRHLLVHLLGGVILMTGIAAWVAATGDVRFESMTAALGAGGLEATGAWLVLAGFLLNAGAPPLSAWLPDAYPKASPTGMVFLSVFTTKTAVYVLIQGFAGAGILIGIGVYMIFYGIPSS